MVNGVRGPNQLDVPEFAVLQRELDPELRGESLLALAGRLVRDDRVEAAGSIYDELQQDEIFSASIRDRARTRLEALRGEGPLGARVEHLFRGFIRQSTDPSALFAMTVAGVAFRGVQFMTLARLVANPSANLITRGLGARALSGLSGFAAEATLFPLAGRLANAALGRESNWSSRALGGDLASSFLMLGALRSFGLTTSSLANRASFLRPALHQAGMLGGIVLGQELEFRAGLRPRVRGAQLLIESLSTLLQFNIAGRMNRGLLGEGFRRWELETETRSRSLGSLLPNLSLPQRHAPLAWAGNPSVGSRSSNPLFPDFVMMASNSDGRGGGSRQGGKLLSMEEFRNRRQPNAANTAGPLAPNTKAEEPRRSLIEQIAQTYNPEFWLERLEGHVMLWLAETPISPRREFEGLRERLRRHPPQLTILLGDLADRRPLAAKLLALRLDLVRPNSWLRTSPEIQAAAEQNVASRYSETRREEIYDQGLQRFLMAIQMDPATPRPLPSDLIQPPERLDALPAELAEAWIDPLLADEQFLTLTDYLKLFQP